MAFTALIDAFEWWLGELRHSIRACLPRRTEERVSSVTVFASRAGYWATGGSGGDAGAAPRRVALVAPASEIAEAVLQPRAIRGSAAVVRVAGDLVLTRSLSPSDLPPRQARAMAELDVMAGTPLDRSDICLVFGQLEAGRRYHIVKRKVLEPLTDAIRSAGGTLASLSLELDDGTVLVDRAGLRSIFPPSRRERWKERSLAAAATGLGLLVLVTFAHAHWRYAAAAALLDGKIAAVRVEAEAARRLIEMRETQLSQREKLRAERDDSVAVVRIWAELTRVLPDAAFVTDLEIAGRQVSLTGFSNAAADLIAPLNASPLFESPEFAAPVVKVPGQEGERFVIRLAVAP